MDSREAVNVWRALVGDSQSRVMPVGLAARDSLRCFPSSMCIYMSLKMCMCMYMYI